ncbi:MAG: 2-C-methyl-D-erythritol 2,4-cyclodiphosphate synthase [Spiribacter sp.]|nr:2-C-methyl-D-erythritol 2,4-cyclodiphosphate synthase [Spiribacter sp.]MDR9489286.1 2-C-methyl-D-erythritol 2,4-cyclodiphosphate synthase [Spiribacter sp.]
MRVGHGVDAHQLVDGRPCILGGVEIPFAKGLLGHSDADVLLHAIADALLGAIGAGDIGQHFPDTDPDLAGLNSRELLRDVGKKLADGGFRLGNIDATLIAQQPKLSPYLALMIANIAEDLDCERSQINLKATTTEWMGFTGRGEGIAASAVALVARA